MGENQKYIDGGSFSIQAPFEEGEQETEYYKFKFQNLLSNISDPSQALMYHTDLKTMKLSQTGFMTLLDRNLESSKSISFPLPNDSDV